jgi:hypothetical protein
MKTLLGIFAVMVLSGCATYHDAGNGRYNVTETTEVRSPFGTNMGFARVANCKGEKAHPNDLSMTLTDCNPVTGWVPMSSQGQGGQVVGGALTGIGAGVGGAMVNTGNSVVQSVITAPAKGGHH